MQADLGSLFGLDSIEQRFVIFIKNELHRKSKGAKK